MRRIKEDPPPWLQRTAKREEEEEDCTPPYLPDIATNNEKEDIPP